MMNFVNAYEVDRRWGGAEEGGWWFNNYTCIDTQPVREDNAEEVVKVLEEKHKDIAYGDIYSVLGGLELMVIVEDSPAASETTRRPHYE